MSETVLTAHRREATGKSNARSLRRAGQVPGVLYGAAQAPTAVVVDARQLERLVQEAGAHGLIDLRLANGDRPVRHKVLIKDLHRDPVYGSVQHVDFHAVALDEELETTVPVEPIGSSQDGMVNLVLWELNIACLPNNIPENIPVDVAGLDVGATVTVQDLTLPEGVRARHEPDEVVLTIARAQATAPETGAAEGSAEGGEAEAGGAGDGGEAAGGEDKEA